MEEKEELCFPQLSNLSCRKPSSSSLEVMTIRVVMSSIALLTVALNLLVIIAISHFRQLHTPTNILLLSLAVSDFLVGLLQMPVEIFRKTSCWFFGDYICFLCNFIPFIITSASIGDMVLISVDRYVAVCDPLRYSSRITERRVKVCVCLCWLCSVCYNTFILNNNFRHPGIHSSCYGECVVVLNFIEGTVDLVVTFIAPISAIIVLYVQVFAAAVTQARAQRSRVTAIRVKLSVSVTAKKSELKAAITLGVLVVVYLICFCPFFSLVLSGHSLLRTWFVSFVIFLFFFNSCLNPLIYTLFYPWFRKALRLIVTLQILQPGSSNAKILR
ncbi:trace amine-associated receptor 13c-like [Halichoeres trimaculatus]|uniref:trace amine-associated receptor 13c-like n=1 Tax=Halichoeres trimaculatus TaxID=147232 RepID=UPI003D9F83B6